MNKKNVFVIGLDDFNKKKLYALPTADRYAFHELVSFDDVKGGGTYPIVEALGKAEDMLERFSGSIDAIVGFWDFPVTSMQPLLCKKYGLPSASVESVLKCEHKYWSRHQQAQVISDIPKFFAVNPWDDEAFDKIELNFPFWLKPVKSFSSHLAFEIHDRGEFDRAIKIIREQIGNVAKPFTWFMRQADLPPEVQDIDGYYCIAEETITGRQCTIEGYVFEGEVDAHGIIDSLCYPGSSVFHRYQYPSQLPDRVKERMAEDARRVLQHIGYDNQPFNIEFFYDENHDRLRLLEINQRISQSHADIFARVDGVANYQVVLDVALGERPDFPCGKGPYPMAAKCFLRRFEDGTVSHSPSESDIEKVQEYVPGTLVDLHAREGIRLSDMIEQDVYSYVLAEIYVGGSDEKDILDKYARVVDELDIEFEGSSKDHYIDVITGKRLGEKAGSAGIPTHDQSA